MMRAKRKPKVNTLSTTYLTAFLLCSFNCLFWLPLLVRASLMPQPTVQSLPPFSSLPTPRALGTGDNSQCPSREENNLCTCYNYGGELYIECTASDLQSIRQTLETNATHLFKSFSIYNLHPNITILPPSLFVRCSNLETLQISLTAISNISLQALEGVEESLKSLSIVNSNLTVVPQNAIINKLKKLENLDLESNDIAEIESYAFYGIPLVSLNLQGNKITALLEHTFSGLEDTLRELSLIANQLDHFPLSALRRLRKLEVLKLQ